MLRFFLLILKVLLKMKLLNKLKLKYLWPYLLVILAIILPWFLKLGYLFFTDNVWGPIIKLDWTGSWFFLKLLLSGLSFIFPVDFLEKIFISGVLVLILLGGRIFVKNILECYHVDAGSNNDRAGDNSVVSPCLVFVLSLFALFNPFVYDRALYGQFGILAAYGFFLFALAYLFKAYRTLNFKKLYPAAIFTALTLMFSVHFIFFLIPYYLVFLIALYSKSREIKEKGLSRKFWLSLLFSIFIVLIINANWLIALGLHKNQTANFVEQGISNQDLVAFQTAGKNGAETFSNVLLMSGFWGKDQFRYFDLTAVPGWQRSFVFLMPLIFYGLYLSLRKRSVKEKIFSLSLLLIFTLAVSLAVGIKSPITNGFVMYLYNHLPLYKGLREPQKWVAVIIPIYLFYLTLGVYKFSKQKFVSANQFVCGVILAAIIIMQAPSLLWGFNRQIKSTPYPNDWAEVNNLLVNRSAQSYGCNDRILFLPWHMYMSFNWVGKIIANPASAYFTCPVLSGTNMEWGGIYDNSQSSEGGAVAVWLAEQGKFQAPLFSSTSTEVFIEGPNLVKGSGLTINSIRYIILAKELDFTSYLWLKDLSYVKPLMETKTLFVYEIK